ncbi:MAG: tyrosine-protein phosphatase [Planctomycetota bacterium]
METGTARASIAWRIALIVLALAAVAWYARYHVRDHVWARNFAVVEAGEVYRSGRLTPAATRRVVENRGIRTIIDLGAYNPGTDEERRAQRTAEALGVTRYRLDLAGDATGNPNEYAHALRLVNNPTNRPVLIHCAAGSERTGCMVALYRAQESGERVDQSLDGLMNEAQRYRDSDQPLLRETLDVWGDRILEAVRTGADVRGAEPTPVPMPVTNPGGRLPTDAVYDADSPYKLRVKPPTDAQGE